MVMNLDFAQTFLDIAGVETPADMQGVSLKPLLEGKSPADWRTSVYYHYYEFPGAHSVQKHYGSAHGALQTDSLLRASTSGSCTTWRRIPKRCAASTLTRVTPRLLWI